MRAFFVTASGTEVGKTVVACLLCRQLRAAGTRVRAVKPVITGFADDAPGGTDTALLLDAQGLDATPGAIAEASPWRFRAALSPDMAARREGRSIDFHKLVDFCRGLRGGAEDVLLIEGLGGVLVPLTERETVADWIAALEVPALLVTGSYLGTLSHTLTAAEALKARGVPLAAVIVSESADSPVPLAETVETLERFVTPVLALPRLNDTGDWRAAPDLTAVLTPVS
ncbi:MAG: dethiobiotin synthase [Proteobacteria bacterium]|nr:dethiobiotin synthase [Pseudomonadota bacterium]